MAFFAAFFALFVDILWAAAISYGAALVAQQFAKDPKKRLPDLGNYPILTSQKGVAIPKVYGCERVSGNVIWMGPQFFYEKKTHQPHVDGHVRVKTYFKDFMVGVAEGPGFITKIWNGKTLIWASDGTGTQVNNDTQTINVATAPTTAPSSTAPGSIRISNGNGTQDARFYTGEDFGKYDDLIWAWFENFETGPTPNIPNFSFEICTTNGYKYTYISGNGGLWGVPLNVNNVLTIDADRPAVDRGGGVTGIPVTNHPFRTGDVIRITGTANYNGARTVLASSTKDELQFTVAFAAETFDGTEVLVKTITGLQGGSGHSAQDAGGNLWYAHTWWAANSTYLTKIAPDGTVSYDDLDDNGTWPINGKTSSTTRGFRITPDSKYLYICIDDADITPNQVLQKYDLATGEQLWSVTAGQFGGYELNLDAQQNVYVAGVSGSGAGTGAVSFDADDGSVITDYGDALPSNYALEIDDAMGLIVASRSTNLNVRTVDNLSGDSITGYGANIGTGNVIIHGGFIYVLERAATPLLHKISWDGTALTTELTVNGPPFGAGLYVELSGNIVVINQDWTVGQDDVMWFYDTDLNFISKQEGMFNSMFRTWVAPAGGAWIHGDSTFFPGISSTAEDENPAIIIEDLVMQGRYGAGVLQQYLNDDSVRTQQLYWEQQENRISLSITEQVPMMDWVDFVLSHCNGFRFWSEGQLHLGAFKDEASIASLTQDDLIREDGPDAPPPVQIVKRKASETSNRIEINWTDRSKVYDLSVAMAQDEVDQRISGKVRIKAADLTGIHNAALAQRQALRLLIETMYRFSMYSFAVSYKNMLLQVGDVIDLTDGHLLTSQRMRILAREEDKDGREIKIEAVEDIAGLYPETNYNTQQTEAVPDDPPGSDDLVSGTLNFREHVTLPHLYLFFAPGDTDTDGALIYRSYDDITYEFVGRVVFDKDTSPNSAGTTTSVLPPAKAVMHRFDESFTVDIGTITSLRTDVSDAEFFNNQSLLRIGDEILAFKTAEDQGSGIWKITQTIRGLFGTEAVEHPVGSNFATVSLIDLLYHLNVEEAGQVIYFKALATSGETVSQTLTDVEETEYEVVREHERPYPLSIQGVRDAVGLITVNAFPVFVEFNLASKEAGYNLGGHGEIGWGHFVKDTRIVGINVRLTTISGVEIVFEYHSLRGYNATDYELTIFETDRIGNEPIRVEMEPVTSLPSYKTTANLIDVVP
jgi:hypothetical protein